MCGWAGFSTWPQVTRFHPFLRLKNILLWMYIAVSSSLHNGRTVLAVDIFDKLNFTGATVPRFDAIQEEFPRELQSSVSFPADFFKPPEEKEGPLGRPASRRTTPQTTRPGPGTEREALISRQRQHPDDAGQFAVTLVIIYRTLGQFLPEHYDPDRRSLRLPHRPIINTPMVSTLVYSEGASLPRPLERPVLVEFALLETGANQARLRVLEPLPGAASRNHHAGAQKAGASGRG
ncbi:cadherin EGF LAG seven-pass G-type receptor 1 isoform X5 [Callithrix jacchus]